MVVWCARADELPGWLPPALESLRLELRPVERGRTVLDELRRARPALLVVDTRSVARSDAEEVVAALKADAYTAVVPCVVLVGDPDARAFFEAGADEVVGYSAHDQDLHVARLTTAYRRNVRDLAAQPTTRLPGAAAIEEEILRRIAEGSPFAACYADLDHFKEFNDRYGYYEGDRVIRMLARVLHDAAVGVAGTAGFVGHIGGDDFMLVLPLETSAAVCELAIEVFDQLVPIQYTEADRRAGYYMGKDRRGHLHRVPLMTLSIGAATTERRRLISVAEVSRLASEMKSFAKARPGSVFAVDRRGPEDGPEFARPTHPLPRP